jgi:enamine deaminase RidA (YjgF/YER057c/UK114 family)
MVAREYLNPPTLYKPAGYTHIVAARGQRVIFISGQIAFDEHETLVGPGDFRAQAEQVYANLGKALAAAGAGFGDVVKLNTYVAYDMAHARPILAEVRRRHVPAEPPASTLVGVTTLALDGLLVEIEAVAVTN